MALPPAFLDELRARTPLPALIGRKVRLVRNGRQWKGCCPFHNEKTPSFYVYDDHFHCFGCGAHGDAISFVMRAEGASFPEAVERLAAEAGLEVPKPSREAAAREARARDLHAVLAAAEAAFRRRLRLPEGRAALDYLRRRGLAEETIARFGLGWAGEGRGALAAELKAEGIEPAQLVAAGLMKPRDPDDPRSGLVDLFFQRVIFPIRDRRGRTVSFGGRILGEGQPKYVNGPETALFRKRHSLYGLDLAREGAFRGATVVAVEGYMDVIALHQAGFAGAVAPLGTALTEEQLEALWQLSPEPVLCFDGDAAGARAAARAAELALPRLRPGRSLRLATLPPGEDPDTLLQRQGRRGFEAVLAAARRLEDAILGLARDAKGDATPTQRAATKEEILRLCGLIPHRALAEEWRRHALDQFYAAYRPRRAAGPGRAALRAPAGPRPPPDPAAARLERGRNLLAILLRHPLLLPEVVEALAALDMPEGPCARLQAALLSCAAQGVALDSALLMDQLARSGLGDAIAWVFGTPGLCEASRPEAQPGEALDGWWHFFGLLRGEAELVADCAEAKRKLVETNHPSAQQRLIRLTAALASLRAGEAGQTSMT
jgi:DNA primase